jgi:hypothetical protein
VKEGGVGKKALCDVRSFGSMVIVMREVTLLLISCDALNFCKRKNSFFSSLQSQGQILICIWTSFSQNKCWEESILHQ